MSMNQTIAAPSQAQGHVFISMSDWPTLPRYRPQMERPLRTMVSSKVLGQLQDSQHVASSLISQRVVALPCLLVNSASSDLQRARRMPLVPQATAVPAGFSGHVFLTASGIRHTLQNVAGQTEMMIMTLLAVWNGSSGFCLAVILALRCPDQLVLCPSLSQPHSYLQQNRSVVSAITAMIYRCLSIVIFATSTSLSASIIVLEYRHGCQDSVSTVAAVA